jgi:tetratricopeptide (TPR) repeat protein
MKSEIQINLSRNLSRNLNRPRRSPAAFLAIAVVILIAWQSVAAEVTPPSSTAAPVETNGQETVRSYLQLQEQLHATQLAIERARHEADEAAAENAKLLAGRLQSIEQALAAQRSQELQAMQSSNKVMLIVAGSFAALGLAAMLFMAYFQWRTVNRLAEISLALAGPHALGPGHTMSALGMGDAHVLAGGSPEQSNARLLGAIDRLEQRIRELEHTSHPLVNDAAAAIQDANPSAHPSNGGPKPDATGDSTPSSEAALISFLLGKGQSLLNLDKAEEALECFEEILALRAETGSFGELVYAARKIAPFERSGRVLRPGHRRGQFDDDCLPLQGRPLQPHGALQRSPRVLRAGVADTRKAGVRGKYSVFSSGFQNTDP